MIVIQEGEIILYAIHNKLELSQVIPYYQAIISADTHSIYGYEVLGRIKEGNKVKSLGAFFHHSEITDEDKLAVDIHIQNIVFENMIKENDNQLFFINVHPNHLINEKGDSFIARLLAFQQRGLNLNNLVLEMTEHEFMGNLIELTDRLSFMKSLGMKIALDDVGTGSSNLDRIGILNPDILKIDIHSLKNDAPTISYHGVMFSLSLLARKIGADILFEAIEDKHQLHYSWKNNARFFQGYFLSKPQAALLDSDKYKFKTTFKNEIREFIQQEKNNINREFELSMNLNRRLYQLIKKVDPLENLDQTVFKFACELGDVCYRLYITDEDGFQQTFNVVKCDGIWGIEKEYKGLNWSWRPFFLENIIRMDQEKRGILSDIYSDIETRELIRTFSFPISRHLFLFIDIPLSSIYF